MVQDSPRPRKSGIPKASVIDVGEAHPPTRNSDSSVRHTASRVSGRVRASGVWHATDSGDKEETLGSMLLNYGPSHVSRMSDMPKSDDESLSSLYQSVEFFPDPPCVVPFIRDAHDDQDDKTALNVVPSYWKQHADWLDSWPGTKEARTRNEDFRSAWNSRLHWSGVDSETGNPTPRSSGRAFVNVCGKAVGMRPSPTHKKQPVQVGKKVDLIHPGQCVIVDQLEEHDGVQFLKISQSTTEGWVFDSINGMTAFLEMKHIDTDTKWYRTIDRHVVELRKAPSVKKDLVNGLVMAPNEIFVGNLRCRAAGYDFIQLADGRGWVTYARPREEQDDTTSRFVPVVEECERDFEQAPDSGDYRSMVPATDDVVKTGLWTYVVGEVPVLALGENPVGALLNPGEVVKVDKKAVANGDPSGRGNMGVMGRQWLRLVDARGWVPETSASGKSLLTEQSGASYPTWHDNTSERTSRVDAKESWMIGIA